MVKQTERAVMQSLGFRELNIIYDIEGGKAQIAEMVLALGILYDAAHPGWTDVGTHCCVLRK